MPLGVSNLVPRNRYAHLEEDLFLPKEPELAPITKLEAYLHTAKRLMVSDLDYISQGVLKEALSLAITKRLEKEVKIGFLTDAGEFNKYLETLKATGFSLREEDLEVLQKLEQTQLQHQSRTPLTLPSGWYFSIAQPRVGLRVVFVPVDRWDDDQVMPDWYTSLFLEPLLPTWLHEVGPGIYGKRENITVPESEQGYLSARLQGLGLRASVSFSLHIQGIM